MITKLRLVFSIAIAFLSFYAAAQNDYWKQQATPQVLENSFSERFDVKQGRVYSLDEQMFAKGLKNVSALKGNSKIVYFPNAEGESVAYRVSEHSVFHPELSRKYPNIKSYAGFALDGSRDMIRFSVSHKGVQSMVVHAKKGTSTFMQKESNDTYVVYSRDPNSKSNKEFICNTKSSLENKTGTLTSRPVDGQVLRKFRLAVSASGEYTVYHGGTVADALAAINATITRVNGIFESDMAVQLELIPNTDEVIFTDPLTDPYSGNLSPDVQSELTSTIGAENYDVGILLNEAAQSDGNAGFIGSVCNDNRKGSAYASAPVPEGDFFDIDFVIHEIGHQFGANHTWSFESEGTAVQVEPGSGTTIMGYAGITGINNVANNSDDYFHYASIVQMVDYLNTLSCAETIALTNNPPVISPTGNFVIPISTAFVLTGEANDLDIDDILTYTWEQVDSGVVNQQSFGPTNSVGANFRSQKPSTNPERYFPKLSSVVEGSLTQSSPTINTAWETVSDVQREMNFALSVRDNAIGGGQVVSDLVNVFVDNSAGPFVIRSLDSNVTIAAGDTEEIVWDVASTNQAPINAQSVNILLSTDGGLTFPITLAEDVPNDGSHLVQLPAVSTTEARIMIKASDNIFFAVNSSDFTIQESQLVLAFDKLEYEVCTSDVLVVPFTYQTFLGFNEEATFSIMNPPMGADIAISPETAIADDTTVNITFTDTQNIPIGNYSIQVLATTASLTKEVVFDLSVINTNFSPLVLSSPLDGEIDITKTTPLEWEVDALATSYDVEIATDAAFTSVVEMNTTINTTFRPVNLENLTTYYWRVKPKNSCGEGNFSSPFSFTTIDFSCQTIEAVDVPITISSVGTPRESSVITVFDDLTVSDINVHLEIDHTFLSDLVVTLTSPAGTSVVLTNNSCGDLSNIDAIFDDDGASFVCENNPAISGTVKPLGSLSSFEGESTRGEWVLTVADNAPSDGGSIKAFSLEICAEGEFRPDDDNDGVFDDGPDLCLGTPAGTAVDTSGCPVLIVSASNYTIEARSESCRTNNDGAILVGVQSDLDYTASFSGTGTNEIFDFTAPSLTLDNLAAGTYRLCITATDGTLTSSEQCFDIVVEEPEILNVTSQVSLDGSFVDLSLSGASLYNIELNGVVSQIESSNIRLNFKAGLNTLKVSTNLPCQGTYGEQFLFSEDFVVYPNPFDDALTVFFGSLVDEVDIRVFSLDGSLVLSQNHRVNATELELEFSTLAAGLYFIQFEAENIKGTSKIVKR